MTAADAVTALTVLAGLTAARPRPRALSPTRPRAVHDDPGGTHLDGRLGVRRLVIPRRERQRHRAILADLPDALELVVLAVRAGHLPVTALRVTLAHLAPSVRPAFSAVIERVDAGERFADALGALTTGLGRDALVVADSFAAADRYGLPLAPVLDRLAAEARLQRRRHAETLARQLPVRLAVPLVACTLPSFVLLAVVPLLLAALSSLSW